MLNLNYELARTKYRKLKERYEALDGKYKFSAAVSEGMQEAVDFLHRAATVQEDRKRAAFSDKSLYHSLWTGEMLELEKARKDIELNRKGMVTLKLTNEEGEPVADVLIEYQQQSHDFLFGVGASALDAQEIALLKKTGINYSSFVAGWQFIEPQLTKFSQEGFRAIDDYFQIRERQKNKLKLKAYGALYFTDPFPEYLRTLDKKGLANTVKRHIFETVKRYHRENIEIAIWNAFDEPTTTNPLKLDLEQLIALTKTSIEAIKEADLS